MEDFKAEIEQSATDPDERNGENQDFAQNPYPGLISYSEELEDYFQGRDTEKQDILQILDLYSVCFLIGKSGLGKSSLIYAGLVPELKRMGCVPIKIRINFDDREDLSKQVKSKIENDIKSIDKDAIGFEGRLLWEYFQEVKIFKGYLKPVLIFDQFEEIFTRGTKRQAELNDILKQIIDLAENRIPEEVQRRYIDQNKTIPSDLKRDYKIIFALREDYLPQLISLRDYLPTIRDGLYRLEQLSEPQAFKAVYGSKQKAKLMDEATAIEIVKKIPKSIDDELEFLGSDKKIEELKNSGKVEPFLLNLFCYTLNEERKAKGVPKITISDVLNKDFQSLIEEHYNNGVDGNWRLGMAIEDELVTPDGKYRKFSAKEQFIKSGEIFPGIGKLTDKDCQNLIDRKLIRRKRIRDLDYFELIHDVLIPVVLAKRKHRILVNRIVAIALLGTLLLIGIHKLNEWQEGKLSAKAKEKEKELRDSLNNLNNLSMAKKLELQKDSIRIQKESINRIKVIADLRSKNDSATRILLQQKSKQEKLELNAKLARIQFDAEKARFEADVEKVKNASRLFEQAQKDALSLRRSDSTRLQTARKYAADARSSNYPLVQRTLAKIAFDTLPERLRKEGVFKPEVYSALATTLKDKLGINKFYKYSADSSFSNINGVINTNGKEYFNRPFYGIEDLNGSVLLKDPALLKSWVSENGILLAFVDLTPIRGKQLKIKESQSDNVIRVIDLPKYGDIQSVLFDPGNTYCIYSTRFPAKIIRIDLRSKVADTLYTARDREVIYLSKLGAGGFVGITNKGRQISWNDFALRNPSATINFKFSVGNEEISSICYSSYERTNFIGCLSGNVYRVVGSSVERLAQIGRNLGRVTCLACDSTGKWLASGHGNGRNGHVLLWNLASNETAPAEIDLAGEVSALNFSSRSNTLTVASRLGNTYNFPLSTNELACLVCIYGGYIDNKESWNQYFPGTNFRKICPCAL